MTGIEPELPSSTAVGAELVRHEDVRREALLAQELAHEPDGGLRVSPALNQHVEDFALVIDSAPKPEPFAADPDHHLVQVPRCARPRPPASQFAGEERPELPDPAPDRLVRHVDAALGQEILDVAKAEREP